MIRYGVSICFVLLLAPVSAGAFEVPYQRIIQQRNSVVAVETYGAGDTSRFASCDLNTGICADAGTSTPELFPQFIERRVVLSDDRSLALLIDDDAEHSRRYVLHTLDAAGISTGQTVLDFAEPVTKAFVSADNTKILFVTTSGSFVVFSISQHAPVRRVPIRSGASFVSFSPHGNYIAYYVPNTANRKERTYVLMDVARNRTYTWKERNTYWDLLSEEGKLFEFSPDERYFLYLSDRAGTPMLYSTRLWLLDGVGGSDRLGKRLFPSQFTINQFLYGSDGSLYFVANRKSPLEWSLYRHDPDDRLVYRVVDDVLYWPPLMRADNHILFARSRGDLPALYALHTQTGKLTLIPVPERASFPIAAAAVKNFSGRYGVLSLPDDYDRNKAYPLIVWLHGGPNRQASVSFHPYHSYGTYDAVLETLRKRGFIILKLDYRGSYGYGAAFSSALRGNVGMLDVRDVVDATKAIKKTMTIDEVYPMGNSYGGYLALRALAGYPKLFAGAISINGVTDWWTLIKQIPSSIFSIHFNGAPSSKNKRLYDQASIFLRLNNLRNKKIVLVHGEDDATIPSRQTTMLYDALGKRGIAATLISYEREGHILADSEHLDDLCNTIVTLPEGYGAKTCTP